MQSRLRFSNFQIPKTIETIHILDCERVTLHHTGLLELHLKELIINSSVTLLLDSEVLRRVDKLVIANVKKLQFEESALDKLESNSVKIINTTFSLESTVKEIKPKLIKEELLFSHSTLPTDFRIHLIDSSPIKQHAPSLVIESCLINGTEMAVHVSSLQMVNNRFQRLPTKQSLNIHYTKYVSLTGNTLEDGGKSLPDVNKNQTIGEINKVETFLRQKDTDVTSFWDAFNFHFMGKMEEKNGKKIKKNDASSPLITFTLLSTMTVVTIIIQ